jgi:TatD DNase family protein
VPDSPNSFLLTDSHAHLEMVAERLGEAQVSVLLAALAEPRADGATPSLLLDPGVEARDLGRRIALARRLSGGALPAGLRFAAGLWPGKEALGDPEASLAALEAEIALEAARGFAIAAVGECGLDYHHMEAPPEVQARLFAMQAALAGRLGLPLIVHSRDAARETLEVLVKAAPKIPVIIHCFGYGAEEARAFLEAGFWLSFAGNLTYKKAEPLREALALTPLDRLLLETDAPYMNPEPRRGRPSSPFDIGRTYAAAAAIKGIDEKELAAIVSANAFRLFPAAMPV